MAVRTTGINPQRWFYGFRDELRKSDAGYTVLAGAACEQWLNGELFRFLAGTLPSRFHPYPEAGKHDIVVFTEAGERAAVVEIKLVYFNYSETKISRYFEALGRQMREAKKQSRRAEVIGLALGAYAHWEGRDPKWTLGEFREIVLEKLEAAAHRFGSVPAKLAVETLLERRDDVKVGGARATVALVGQYLRFPKK